MLPTANIQHDICKSVLKRSLYVRLLKVSHLISIPFGYEINSIPHLTPSLLASGEMADTDHNEHEDGSAQQPTSGNNEKYLTEARFVSTQPSRCISKPVATNSLFIPKFKPKAHIQLIVPTEMISICISNSFCALRK